MTSGMDVRIKTKCGVRSLIKRAAATARLLAVKRFSTANFANPTVQRRELLTVTYRQSFLDHTTETNLGLSWGNLYS